MSKTDLWDRLGKTDPAHTKPFKRAGGFSGTAIKPMWSFRRVTEEFGPCGVGWGVNQPSFQVVHTPDEVLVFCTVSIWHGVHENVVFGVGGDKVLGRFKSGPHTDDEAFKKAYTDAITNALKLIGVGADVHMGMFDDSKYVNELKAEFEAEEEIDTRQRYIDACNAKIDAFDPAKDDPKPMLIWWADQHKARDDFLNPAQRIEMRARLTAKLPARTA
jgi:hypothetical protein